MPLHDSTYKHWQGEHLGIWRRRGVIAANGLRGAFQGKWLRHIVVLCWGASLIQIALLFFIGQLLVKDSMVVQWLSKLHPTVQNFANSLVLWLESHPEISVRATQNVLFYYFAKRLLILSFVAIALAIPHLITRDLGSNAIIMYASRAVSRFDYLLGKFFALFGLLALTWLGPVLAAWFVGNLLSPKWSFFWHSRGALFNLILYLGITMTILSIVGLAVSALASRERTTVAIWTTWWMVSIPLVVIGAATKPWLRYLSLNFNIDQVGLAIFRIDRDILTVQDNLPFFNQVFRGFERKNPMLLQEPHAFGSVVVILLLVGLSIHLLLRKVKPE